MSKTRTLRMFTYSLPCTVENIVPLLDKAGWTVRDAGGNIHIWNTKSDEWELFSGIYERFLLLPRCTFKAFSGDISVDVWIEGGKSFDITLEPKYTAADGELVFDFNWYYSHLVERINSERCLIEHIIFEEY